MTAYGRQTTVDTIALRRPKGDTPVFSTVSAPLVLFT